MNRSILIVICDFLLVSLLAFSTVDINKVSSPGAPHMLNTTIVTNQPEGGRDLAAVMRVALEDERKRRDLLMGELNNARASTSQQQQQLRAQEEQTRQLQQQYTSAQSSISSLKEQLDNSSTEAILSKEKLAQMEAQLKKQTEESAALQQRMAQLAASNQMVLNEKQQLSGKLVLAETEKRYATEQAVRMTEEVKVEREEKAKLADGVKSLATKSGELTQEIRENRPLTANTIFNDFLTNRVEAQFAASKSGIFGLDSNKRKAAQTILVSNGTNIFALCHVEDTPLTFWIPGTEWESLTGTLTHEAGQVSIRSLTFNSQDPRIVLMPVSSDEARQLGGKVYRVSADPYKFQDAVLVGASEGYYGECKFEIDLNTPQYVKLNRNLLKGIFGQFNPSRGDLVFSKSGELLGVMANGSYCLMLQSFGAMAEFQFGPDVRDQHTGTVLAQLYNTVNQMPTKLR